MDFAAQGGIKTWTAALGVFFVLYHPQGFNSRLGGQHWQTFRGARYTARNFRGGRMTGRNFKRGHGPSFTKLDHWFLDCEAWATMKPGPRALYLEFKRLFKGANNGALFFSHRDAAKRLNVGRDTVAGYFDELTKRGFIVQTRGHCLGPSGIGRSATYALTELPLNKTPATKEFMRWKKQKPRRKIQHPMAGKPDTPCRKIQPLNNQMSENPTAFAPNSPIIVSENPAIYTSNHIPNVK